MRRRFSLVVILLALFNPPILPLPSEAAGPWKAQVVDADTGKPIEGAVVVAIWERRAHGHPAIGFGRTGYYTHEEVITDAEGRFVIPARTFANPPLFFPIEGPDLLLFKGSYGPWRFQRSRSDLTSPTGAVIEMRPLRDVRERVAYMERRWKEPDPKQFWSRNGRDGPEDLSVPYQQIQRYETAINNERILLGLKRIGLGFPYLGDE